MDHPDSIYINALITNSEPLLKELYQKCFGKIRHFITHNNGTEDDAWDILQEAMTSIFLKVKQQSFTLTCPFDAFIYIVCRNLWTKHLRNKRLPGVTLDPEMVSIEAEDDIAHAEDCARQHERRELLLEKLTQLGKGCRELLQQNWRGAQLNEVAAKLNISYAYARKRKTECMAKLISLIKQSPLYEQLKW